MVFNSILIQYFKSCIFKKKYVTKPSTSVHLRLRSWHQICMSTFLANPTTYTGEPNIPVYAPDQRPTHPLLWHQIFPCTPLTNPPTTVAPNISVYAPDQSTNYWCTKYTRVRPWLHWAESVNLKLVWLSGLKPQFRLDIHFNILVKRLLTPFTRK